MKKSIISAILAILKLLLLSLLCDTIYAWNHLEKVFGPNITFSQWIAIIAMINILTPDGIINSIRSKNDEQRP